MPSATRRVFNELKRHGLLLLNDPDLPNLCALIVGERVRGSWWAHSRAQEIFNVYNALEDHPEVLIMKLVSGKVTYVHRRLWPQIVAVGRKRDTWQMDGLSPAARKLLANVDCAPVEPGREMSKAASELEARMLVYGAQFHSESGAHVRRLESWRHWSGHTGASPDGSTGDAARAALEAVLASLNAKFGGKGVLPWQKQIGPRVRARVT
jgi:hypothetical protein